MKSKLCSVNLHVSTKNKTTISYVAYDVLGEKLK